jgi:hypothetical protein
MNFSNSIANRLKPVCIPEIAGLYKKFRSRKSLNQLKPTLRPAKASAPAKAGPRLAKAGLFAGQCHPLPASIRITALPASCFACAPAPHLLAKHPPKPQRMHLPPAAHTQPRLCPPDSNASPGRSRPCPSRTLASPSLPHLCTSRRPRPPPLPAARLPHARHALPALVQAAHAQPRARIATQTRNSRTRHQLKPVYIRRLRFDTPFDPFNKNPVLSNFDNFCESFFPQILGIDLCVRISVFACLIRAK